MIICYESEWLLQQVESDSTDDWRKLFRAFNFKLTCLLVNLSWTTGQANLFSCRYLGCDSTDKSGSEFSYRAVFLSFPFEHELVFVVIR